MIFQFNNRLHYTGNYTDKINASISVENYPAQNYNFLGKFIFLGYRDENAFVRDFRLYISNEEHPEFTGRSADGFNQFKILRFDKEFPYIAVCVGKHNEVIVADSQELSKLKLYPRYQYSTYRNIDEAKLSTTATWDEFNRSYDLDTIYVYHVQNMEFLGKPAYVEFGLDILNRDKSFNNLERTYAGDKEARYNQDLQNVPLRAHHQGYIIRADENGDRALFVVMVEDESGDRKYFVSSESFAYYDSDMPNRTLEELDLWQTVLR